MRVLAVTDGWVVAMWAINLAANVVWGAALAWVAQRTRRAERVEAELREASAGWMDERLTGLEGRVMGEIRQVGAAVAELGKRLERLDVAMRGEAEKRERMDRAMLERIAEVRGMVKGRCALKEEQVVGE